MPKWKPALLNLCNSSSFNFCQLSDIVYRVYCCMNTWNIYFHTKISMTNANHLAINLALIRNNMWLFLISTHEIYSTKKFLSQLMSIWCVEKPNFSLYETSDMCSPLNYLVDCIASKEYNRIIQMTGQCGKCYFNTHSISNWDKRTYPKSNTFHFSFNCYKSKLAKLIFSPLTSVKKFIPEQITFAAL